MLCADFVEEDQISLLMTERLYCARHYATELSAFRETDISSDTASKHSETLCRPCYMHLMRLKRSTVPLDLTLQAAKEDIDKLSISSVSADQCVPTFLPKGWTTHKTKTRGEKEVQQFQKQTVKLTEA